MPLRALLLVTEQPQGGPSDHLKHNNDNDKYGSTLLSPAIHGSASRPSSLRSSIAGFFPNIAGSERSDSTVNLSTIQSSRVSLPQSDAHPGPGTTRSSVHSATPSVLQTTSGTDYAASSPPHSPPPVPGVVPSIRMPTAYMHLIRTPPEPELDDKGRPKLRLRTEFPAVGTALRYYKHVPEDEEEDEREGQGDVSPGEVEELGETEKRTHSKLKTDWKSNPRAKPGRRKDEESTKNPLHAPTRTTPPVRFVREEDQFAKWLNEDAFWAGKRIPKVEFGWWKRSAVEILEILTKAESKRQRKNNVAAAAAGTDDPAQPHHKPEHASDEDGPLPTARMTELTATHHRTPVACMSVGANWQFPIPVAQLTHEQLTGLVKRGLLVVALPPGQNAEDWGVETLSTVPTAGPWEERDGRTAREKQKQRERESAGIPALAVVPPSPLHVSSTNSDEASTTGANAIKEGFSSLFSRAKNAREQFLKPTAHPITTSSSSSASSHSSAVLPSPPAITTSTSDVLMTEVSLFSPSIPSPPPVPSSPRLFSGSGEARKSTDALSVRSSDTLASTSTASGGSRTSQWMSWASSKWGRS